MMKEQRGSSTAKKVPTLCPDCHHYSRPYCGLWQVAGLASHIAPGAKAQQAGERTAFATVEGPELSPAGTPPVDVMTLPVIRVNLAEPQSGSIATPLGFFRRADNRDDALKMKGQIHGCDAAQEFYPDRP